MSVITNLDTTELAEMKLEDIPNYTWFVGEVHYARSVSKGLFFKNPRSVQRFSTDDGCWFGVGAPNDGNYKIHGYKKVNVEITIK